jgi:phosphoribosylformylglycinamidine synthase
MEACLELMQTGAVISIQDMGAAGLTCSAVEMGDKGNLGISLDLEKVPTREPNMSAYEMMLSESQERMLMVLDPEKENIAKHIFDKWDLDFAIVGETISDDRFLIKLDGVVKADLPLKALAGNAPEYDRPWSEGPPVEELKDVVEINAIDGLKALISSANYSSKSWIYEQYDSQVMADTIERPGFGAGIVRVHGTEKSIAFTSDVTPRYVRANPFEGGKQAVAEAFRNLISVGARPLASTDNLNFGNPEKPEVMGQFVQAVKGISNAVRELNMPIVSGNVSLYNETDGVSINPTPTIGAIGLISAAETPINGKAYEGNMAVLIGETKGHLGQTALLQEVFNRSDGDAPKVNLETEKKHGNFILTNRNLINACTDLSDGGLALAAFELAHRSEIGFEIYEESTAFLFGEDQARYLIACEFDQAESLFVEAGKQNIPIQTVGSFKGDTIIFGNSKSDMASLSSIFTDTFKNLFQN